MRGTATFPGSAARLEPLRRIKYQHGLTMAGGGPQNWQSGLYDRSYGEYGSACCRRPGTYRGRHRRNQNRLA